MLAAELAHVGHGFVAKAQRVIHTVGVMRVAGAAVAVVASVAAGAGAPPSSGLYGTVTRGPTMPVCRVGVPCSAPADGVTLTFRRLGSAVVTRMRTSRTGTYRVRLAPGTYTVRTSAKPFGVIPFPARAWVARARFRRVNFEIDTGIR
jgi:hypothetical protein